MTVSHLFAPLPVLAETTGHNTADLAAWIRASRRAGLFPVATNTRARVDHYRVTDFRRWLNSLNARYGTLQKANAS